MRYRFAREVGCEHTGRRVTLRYADAESRPAEAVGVLEACDDDSFSVRDRRGRLVVVPRDKVIASRLVAPPRRPVPPRPYPDPEP
ncbi:MAG: hypothetical protein HY775_01200 [Acidobacteria bacterium]|nr:hypothetical protein [Acidobacteriota bacterium]